MRVRRIYHITHLDNLPNIIEASCLWSDSQRIKQRFPCKNIGFSHIKARRLKRRVGVAAGGVLGDYVPFNFCPRSVMLYVIFRGHDDYRGGQSRVIHLVASMEEAVKLGRPWAFTDRHAELGYAQYSESLEDSDIIDWSVMPLRYWVRDAETRERRQAEFLVHDWFPWTCFRRIGVYNQQVAAEVEKILEGADHQPIVKVERGWYY